MGGIRNGKASGKSREDAGGAMKLIAKQIESFKMLLPEDNFNDRLYSLKLVLAAIPEGAKIEAIRKALRSAVTAAELAQGIREIYDSKRDEIEKGRRIQESLRSSINNTLEFIREYPNWTDDWKSIDQLKQILEGGLLRDYKEDSRKFNELLAKAEKTGEVNNDEFGRFLTIAGGGGRTIGELKRYYNSSNNIQIGNANYKIPEWSTLAFTPGSRFPSDLKTRRNSRGQPSKPWISKTDKKLRAAGVHSKETRNELMAAVGLIPYE
jgi:hypothetical protein